MKGSFLILAIIILGTINLRSQNYINLGDSTGLDLALYQSELNSLTNILVDSFPGDYPDSFKIFSAGFYYPSSFIKDGLKKSIERSIEVCESISQYFLFIGRESNSKGICDKYWITLKLPMYNQFSCMSDLQRAVYIKRIEKIVDDLNLTVNKSYTQYDQVEKAALQELAKIISEIKDCCPDGRMPISQCTNCSEELSDSYFNNSGFNLFSFSASKGEFANINTSKIFDISNIKYHQNQISQHLGNYFSDIVNDINEYHSFKLIITSNDAICDSYSILDIENLTKQTEFCLWINAKDTLSGFTEASYKLYWNRDKSNFGMTETYANSYLNNLLCLVYYELQLLNELCDFSLPQITSTTCSYSIPLNSTTPSGGLTISQFIDLVKEEEAKYNNEEQEDTKTMVTRFRKLFYGSSKWDERLIKGVESIKCIKPYIIESSINNERTIMHNAYPNTLLIKLADIGYFPIHPMTGQRPAINKDHIPAIGPQTQEVRLQNGSHAGNLVDIGHVLCVLDAFYNENEVGVPIPLIVGLIDRNIDAVSWLGDLASAQAEIVISNTQGNSNSVYQHQKIIDYFSSGPDMLGNIDGVVIFKKYIEDNLGIKKLSDILTHYYLGNGLSQFQNYRYSVFSDYLGLNLDEFNYSFTNERERMNYYDNQINYAAEYYVLGMAQDANNIGSSTVGSNILSAGLFADEVSVKPLARQLIKCFFESILEKINQEP